MLRFFFKIKIIIFLLMYVVTMAQNFSFDEIKPNYLLINNRELELAKKFNGEPNANAQNLSFDMSAKLAMDSLGRNLSNLLIVYNLSSGGLIVAPKESFVAREGVSHGVDKIIEVYFSLKCAHCRDVFLTQILPAIAYFNTCAKTKNTILVIHFKAFMGYEELLLLQFFYALKSQYMGDREKNAKVNMDILNYFIKIMYNQHRFVVSNSNLDAVKLGVQEALVKTLGLQRGEVQKMLNNAQMLDRVLVQMKNLDSKLGEKGLPVTYVVKLSGGIEQNRKIIGSDYGSIVANL